MNHHPSLPSHNRETKGQHSLFGAPKQQTKYRHHKSMSCGDVYASLDPTWLASIPRKRSSDAASSSVHPLRKQYHHGRKPSLVGFDPFSSEELPFVKKTHHKQTSVDASLVQSGIDFAAAYITPAIPTQTLPISPPAPPEQHFATHASPGASGSTPSGRDSSPSLKKSSPNDRQPPTPPSECQEPPIEGFGDKNNNKAHSKGRPRNKVNKFLRKSALVKSLSKGSKPKPSCPEGTFDKAPKEQLEDLKAGFETLQLPSLLQKASPTSFLTGSEVVSSTNVANEPSPFQLEIPSCNDVGTLARLIEFVENYRRMDQNLDLNTFVGWNKTRMQKAIDASNSLSGTSLLVKEHVPILESLLECTEDSELSLQGFVTEDAKASSERTEAVIFQGQRNFIVVFRGTNEEQAKGLLSKAKKKTSVLETVQGAASGSPPSSPQHKDHPIEVYSGFQESYVRIQESVFSSLDRLMDENPFCDVVFGGYSFGGALATLASYQYAKARPMIRVGCQTLGSPKVGFSHFQQAVHALSNLQVLRLELPHDAMCQGPTLGGCHVGHTLVLQSLAGTEKGNLSPKQEESSVSVYKFDVPPSPGIHKGFFKGFSNHGLKKYISTLEDLSTDASLSWAKDFCNTAGDGVVVNNESRQMV